MWGYEALVRAALAGDVFVPGFRFEAGEAEEGAVFFCGSGMPFTQFEIQGACFVVPSCGVQGFGVIGDDSGVVEAGDEQGQGIQ